MSDFGIAIIVVAIAVMVLLDALVLRWLRRRPNRKFDLHKSGFLPSGRRDRNYPNSDTPPCWPYGWPGE